MGKIIKKTTAELALIEMRLAIVQHCVAMKRTIKLFACGNITAGVASMDGAVTALEAALRSQVAGLTLPCPACNKPLDIMVWVNDQECTVCGAELVWPNG